MAKFNPKNASGNWCIVAEFPSYVDAKAFQDLTADLGPLRTSCRPKHAYTSGEVKDWRLTTILCTALSGQSFHISDATIVAEEHGYRAATVKGWIVAAKRGGLVRRLEKGIYEFLPLPTGAVAKPDLDASLVHDPQCAACQPEPLQCTAQ